MKYRIQVFQSLLLSAILFLSVFGFPIYGAYAEDGLHIYYLDVGQGDAAIILCDGEAMMIDGGDPSNSQFIYSVLRNTLELDHLDIMVATHPHADHIGGLAAALNACSVGVIYTPLIDYDTKTWQSVLQYADAQGTPVIIPEPGDILDLGEATVEILGPIWYHNELNDMSLIIKITYGETKFLFTGDAELEAEQDLLDYGVDLSADVLKVGHHGSRSSSSYDFLQAVAPRFCVISVGEGNQYGHPDEEVLDRISEVGAIVLRTDQVGTIECFSNGEEVLFSFNASSH